MEIEIHTKREKMRANQKGIGEGRKNAQKKEERSSEDAQMVKLTKWYQVLLGIFFLNVFDPNVNSKKKKQPLL